jgi:RNA polymerase sigma factor (sigma-70 family)
MHDNTFVGQPASGEAVFLQHLDLIEHVVAFVCSRHHLSAADAEDFASHVKLKFVERGYEILTKFGGRSSLRTYLSVVIQRLFLDYRASAWGKWRPSAEARRRGPVATLLERMLSRDGYGFEEACELLATNHGIARSRDELERLAGSLPPRVKRRTEPESALANLASSAPGTERNVAESEQQQTAARVSAAMWRLLEAFEVQDRLILTLRFEDGRTVAEIAAALRLDQKGLYRRMDRLLRQLRTGLEGEGIERAAVMEMLESPAVNIGWGSHAGIAAASPSMEQGDR